MIIVTPRNDVLTPFDKLSDGDIFLNSNQDYCMKIQQSEGFDDNWGLTVSYNIVNLANGHLGFIEGSKQVLPLPDSELHINF